MSAAADINSETLDFLIEGGKRNHKSLGGFGLVPAGALQHINNNPALDLVHDLEQGRLRMVRRRTRTGLAGKRRQKFRELQAHTANDLLAANAFREQVHIHALLSGEDHRALDDVLELPHVAGPIVIHQQLHGRRCELPEWLRIFLAIAVQEMRQQKGHIFATLAQRRNLEVNHVQAVIQVFAEAALANKRKQVDVGSGHDAHVDFKLLGAPQTHEFALLDHAQKLGLRFGADGGDFIEENGALIGDFKKALFRSNGAGESALHMAEKLGLQEIHGDRSRIYGHKGFVRAGGSGMNGFGDEFLTGAAFAADENGGARRRDLRDEVQKHLHFVALADNVREIEALLQGAFKLDVFIAQPARFHGLRHLGKQFIVGPRLGDVVHRAILESGAGHVDRAVGSDQDDGELRIAAVNLLEHVQTVAVRQADVQQEKVIGMLFQFLEAGLARFRAGGAVSFTSQQEVWGFADF